ncbi:MAG: hypothetical protein MK117_05180, partial [Gemmatimonadetes bacterium]|nr:hypothetical protein [Gemmatimonadota bacterium]
MSAWIVVQEPVLTPPGRTLLMEASMRASPMLILAPLMALALPAQPGIAQTNTDPELTEWMVPYEASRPRDP